MRGGGGGAEEEGRRRRRRRVWWVSTCGTGHVALVDQLAQVALAHDGVLQVEPRELDLARGRLPARGEKGGGGCVRERRRREGRRWVRERGGGEKGGGG
eukprot:5924427-Prymnesium_polylepis.1